jgi:hypothetical protein
MNSMMKLKSVVSKSNIFKYTIARNQFSSNPFSDKEKVEEKIFIDKNERNLMKLLAKLQAAGEIEKPHDQDDHDAEELKHVLERHSKHISKELFGDLLKWKKGQI